MPKQIIQIQLLDEVTGAVIETVIPETEARAILVIDGATEVDLQTYLENLVLSGGEKGDKGDTGDKGTAGSKMYNVTAAPTTGLGVVGDWALNTANGDVYEKTAAAVWTNRGNFKGAKGDTGTAGLKGDQGVKGTDGKTVLNGTINPAAGTGVDGDFYINTTASTLFGPKSSGAWGAGKSLIGPQGSTGTNGAKGDKGDPGDSVKYGADYASGQDVKVFFKTI